MEDAYTVTPVLPLGRSEHNHVFLEPMYKPLVQKQPKTTHTFRKWTPESEETLRDCFESTDWSVLQDPHGEDIEAQLST